MGGSSREWVDLIMADIHANIESELGGIDAPGALVRSLRGIRGRMLRVGGSAAVAWAVAGAALCLIFGVWADLVFELSPKLRIAVLMVAAGAGLLLLAGTIVRTLRAGRSDLLARRLDLVGATGGQIRSGTDLMHSDRRHSSLTGGLAHMAIERAALLARQVAAERAVPVRPLIAAFGVATVIAVVIGLTSVALPSLASTEYLRFRDPFGDHPPYSRVSFQVEPGNADVVYGAAQEIKIVTAGGSVERLDLVLLADGGGSEEVLPMFGEPGGIWRATVASVTSPARYFVRCDAGRSHRFRLGVITLPKLESVRFRISPPAYTHRGAYEGGLPQAGLAGLPGTLVEVWAKSNRPLSQGTLQISGLKADAAVDREVMQPTAPGEHEVKAGFEIREPGRIEIRVRDVEGQESQDAFTTTFAVRSDERPFVRLLDPPPTSLCTPTVELPVAMAAEDDYGISRLSLYRSLNDSRALPVDMPVPDAPPSTRQNHGVGLPLPSYSLRPGDEIKLFARVEDNDPAGTKGSESPLAIIRIISQEDYERLVITRQGMEVLMSKYQQARRRMEEIAARIEELQKELAKQSDDAELSAEMRKQIQDLAAKMQQESQEIAKAADNKLPFDIDEKMNEHLRDLAEKLAQAAKEVDEFAKAEPSPKAGEAKEGLEQIRKFCKGGQQEYQEKTTEPLEQLAKIYPLMEDQARFTALYKRQKELADRLDSLRGKDTGDDPQQRARMRDLESEQYKVREDLKNLLQDIEDHLQQLPEDSELDELRQTAGDFLSGVRDSGATEAMADAETGLAAFSGTRGAEGSREAEQILKRFLGNCNSMGKQGKACLKFAPGLGESLGNTVEQLLAGAGLNMGQNGMGMAGSGYSAQSSTLDNVGLFGHLPTLGGGDRAGESKDAMSARGARAGNEGNFESGDPGRLDPLEPADARGDMQNLVPAEYRQRVGAYFERITDEIGNDKEREKR